MDKKVFLSLGSNVGNRAAHIARAIAALNAAGVRVTRQSKLYRTEPVGAPRQQWFANCVVEAQTALLPRQLLHAIRRVEHALGRRRGSTERAPRKIDIDILLYAAARIRTRDLEIPHPRMHQRRFVLVPLAELAPELHHPVLKQTISSLVANTADRSQIQLLDAAIS